MLHKHSTLHFGCQQLTPVTDLMSIAFYCLCVASSRLHPADFNSYICLCFLLLILPLTVLLLLIRLPEGLNFSSLYMLCHLPDLAVVHIPLSVCVSAVQTLQLH